MREPAPASLAAPSGKPPRRPRRIIAWPLRSWWTLAAFVGAAILGDLLLLPLALTPDHWRQGVQSQFDALLQLAQTYPLQSLGAGTLLVVLTLAGAIANQRARAAEQRAALAYIPTPVIRPAHHAQPATTTTSPTTPDLPQRPQADAERPRESLREEIGQLAQRAARAEQTGITRRVFLSSTAVDLAAHRLGVHDTLERMNQVAVDMAQFGAGGADATTVSLRELASADFVVLIVAWRYGFIPQGETRSITQIEYEEALRRGVPILVYLADPATEADTSPTALFPADTRNPQQAAQLAAFRAMLSDSDTNTYDTFTTPDNLARKAGAALSRRLLSLASAATLARPDATGRVMALADMPAPTPLIGRDAALDDLARRLGAGEAVGVFALEGMGGVGKTALAAAAVERFADDTRAFPGGVAWLACAGLEGDAGLQALLAQVARLVGREDIARLTDLSQLRQALSAALRGCPLTLLALDNVEPGLDAEAALRTLATPGHTTLLLTAREQVAPRLVYAVRLAPLPTPDAARLFAQRLWQDTGGARPTPEDEPQIPALAEAVGGLPLAVELLAADAGGQGTRLATLRTELDTLGVNAAAFRADPQRALTATFDRSWVTLPEHQRRLFAGLGLLPESGFPRAAAEALALAAASDEAAPQRSPDPASDVAALVRAALVEPLGDERLRLHPLLRAYARDRLAGPEAPVSDALGDALLAFWPDYAQAHPSDDGQNVAGMDALEAEASGLLGALTWAHDHARWRSLLDIVQAINWTWYVRGRRADERRFLPWAVEAARALNDRAGLRWALHELAVLDALSGEPQRARAGYQEALALARDLGDKRAIRGELHGLARIDADSGEPQRARASFQEALALARELGDKRAIQRELHELALLDAQSGDPQRARAGYEEALALARALGDTRAIRAELHELAVLDAQSGNSQRARAGYEEALALARDLGDVAAQSLELLSLGVTDRQAGKIPQAREELSQALALALQAGAALQIAHIQNSLGFLERDAGDTRAACAAFREALARFERLGSPEAREPRSMLRRLGCEP